eukprot:3795702-Rhodomonas_salina.3
MSKSLEATSRGAKYHQLPWDQRVLLAVPCVLPAPASLRLPEPPFPDAVLPAPSSLPLPEPSFPDAVLPAPSSVLPAPSSLHPPEPPFPAPARGASLRSWPPILLDPTCPVPPVGRLCDGPQGEPRPLRQNSSVLPPLSSGFHVDPEASFWGAAADAIPNSLGQGAARKSDRVDRTTVPSTESNRQE